MPAWPAPALLTCRQEAQASRELHVPSMASMPEATVFSSEECPEGLMCWWHNLYEAAMDQGSTADELEIEDWLVQMYTLTAVGTYHVA